MANKLLRRAATQWNSGIKADEHGNATLAPEPQPEGRLPNLVDAAPAQGSVAPTPALTPIGPNVKKLIIQRMSVIAVPAGGGLDSAIKFLTTRGALASGWKEASHWLDNALQAVRLAAEPNPWKESDDESIAGELLRRLEEKKKEITVNVEIPEWMQVCPPPAANPGDVARTASPGRLVNVQQPSPTVIASSASITQVMERAMPRDILFARAFDGLFRPARYKIYYGGRGGAKSWSVARALITKAHSKKLRIGCFRELQNSIADSVHRLIVDQINAMGLADWFEVTQKSIVAKATGSEFLFKGLRHNATEIKSTEGIDIAWVEEAQLVSKDSWELLIPTIRKEGSEIWITFNPLQAKDETFTRFVTNTPPDSVIEKVNFDRNPWFPKTLEAERLYMLRTDPIAYQHIWEGDCRTMSDAVIMRGKFVVEPFETPEDPAPRFLHGADFGFSQDPFAMMRMYITDNEPTEITTPTGDKLFKITQDLWIDREAYGVGVDTVDLPDLVDKKIATARQWPVYGDNSRPETISHLRRMGFNIAAADKWKGCVEDGIAHLRAFRMIHIHERHCPHMAEEARLYSYKVDKNTEEILPDIVDKHNHCWDAVRYALDKFIQRRGVHGVWSALAK